jgi:hypothetical protein
LETKELECPKPATLKEQKKRMLSKIYILLDVSKDP